MPGDTEKLGKFIAEVDYQDLPQEVVQKVKHILLDSIGCALGGYATDKAKIVLGFVREMGGNPQTTIIGSGRTSASNAAFAANIRPKSLNPGAKGKTSLRTKIWRESFTKIPPSLLSRWLGQSKSWVWFAI